MPKHPELSRFICGLQTANRQSAYALFIYFSAYLVYDDCVYSELRDSQVYERERVLMKALKIIGRILLVIFVTLIILCAGAVGVIYILEKGPSETAKVLFVRSVNETSRIGFLSRIFLSKEEVDEILTSTDMRPIDEGETTDSDLIVIDEVTDEVDVIDVKGETFKGKLMIVHDPSKVFCGVIPEFGLFQGMDVADMIDVYTRNGYDIIGGVNGGDFIDNGTNNSFTAQPLGAVISEGKIVFADSSDYDNTYYHLCALTNENKLLLGNITLNQALEAGVRDAIYCVHNTGPFLVVDGEAMINEVPDSATYGGGKNPRTAIGQRKDGSILLLVVDGRQANSLGATFKDLALCMLENGAVNAAAMDGGTSSQMVYKGEVINNPYSPFGPRKCPTAWLVKN